MRPNQPVGWLERAAASRRDVGARAPNSEVISVLCWNLQLLPVQAGACLRRAQRAVVRIAALAPDIVCLQEVWDAPARDALVNTLSAGGYHVHSPATSSKCGLVIFSKQPLAGCVFYKFQGATGTEGTVFDKGVQGALVKTNRDGTAVAVANAHTQSNAWGDGSAARAKQMVEVRELTDKLRAAAAAADLRLRGVIVCGDFNFAAGSDEARENLVALGPSFEDLLANNVAAVHTFPLGAWRWGRYARRKPNVRLDYVCAQVDGAPSGVAAAEPEMAHDDQYNFLSDHAPVTAVIALSE